MNTSRLFSYRIWDVLEWRLFVGEVETSRSTELGGTFSPPERWHQKIATLERSHWKNWLKMEPNWYSSGLYWVCRSFSFSGWNGSIHASHSRRYESYELDLDVGWSVVLSCSVQGPSLQPWDQSIARKEMIAKLLEEKKAGKKWIFGGFRAYMFVCCLLWFCVGVQCFIFAFDVFSGWFFGVIFLLSVHRFLFHYFVKSIVDVLSKCFCWRLLRLLLRLLCFLLLLLQFMFCSDEATCILLKA